jgi:hypothetical protein
MEMTIGKRFTITSGVCLLLIIVLGGISLSALYSAGNTISLFAENTVPTAYNSLPARKATRSHHRYHRNV